MLPLVKLGYLLIRTIAKPISGMIKQQAKEHPTFRRNCVRVAQYYHRVEVRMRRRLAARQAHSPESVEAAVMAAVRPLDESKAVELGASFISEAIVFGVAGALLIAESARAYRAEQVRRRMIEERFEQLFSDISSLYERVEAHENNMTNLNDLNERYRQLVKTA